MDNYYANPKFAHAYARAQDVTTAFLLLAVAAAWVVWRLGIVTRKQAAFSGVLFAGSAGACLAWQHGYFAVGAVILALGAAACAIIWERWHE